MKRLTTISQCQTGETCVGTAAESKTTIAYGTANVLPTSTSSGSGDGSLTATTSFTWDTIGNRLTIDAPLSGTADTTAFVYDLDRELVGVIGPDPDGAGSLKNRAVRVTYNADAQVTKQEVGTTLGQSATNWANFVPLQAIDTAYDSNARPVTQKLTSGATSYALTQTSYDSLGRIDCAAQRMNPAICGSLPASACTMGTQGSHGPDRITKMAYDAVSRPVQVKVGVGTSDAATERTTSYTDNGTPQYVIDGEGQKSQFVYDGFDRPQCLIYPSTTRPTGYDPSTQQTALATSGAVSGDCIMTGVYERLTYDENGNVTAFRNRAGFTTGFTYDHLNRVATKDLLGTEPDVTYDYDNLGRLISANQTGHALSFTYDALSRNLTEVGPQGTATFAWDLAGRRTQIYYPSGGTSALTVNYTYFTTGELKEIKQGSTVLATYAYDDGGNRTGVTFLNGVSQSYGFDPVSRLTSLGNDLDGEDETNDLARTFEYNNASQIVEATSDNNTYVFAKTTGSEAGVANGLNQLTQYAGKTVGHDDNGNVSGFGTDSYTYSNENLLTIATVGGTTTNLSYDPLLRLYETSSGGTVSRYAYDGLNALAEYDGSGVLQRRWVFDPTTGQPVVWYEGGGSAAKRYLGADERGSIISVSDPNGASLGINTYDEYGIPAAGNLGRYGYTGQAWLGAAKLWYLNARMYAPQVGGTFLQPDPIGYDGGMNIYVYTGGDPVNYVDPLGLTYSYPRPGGDWNCDWLTSGWTCVWTPAVIVSGRAPCRAILCQVVGSLPDRGFNDRTIDSLERSFGRLRGRNRAPQSSRRCGVGPRVNYGAQFSGTGFLASLGISVSVGVGVSVPANPVEGGSQIYLTGNITGLAGLGFFAGAGPSRVVGASSAPLSSGFSSSTSVGIQGGLAAGGGGEAAVLTHPNGSGPSSSSLSGGPRAGMGGYLAGAAQGSATLASPLIGC